MQKIDTLLEEYNNFKDAQIRSVKNLTETSKLLTIVILDDDGEDVKNIELTFSDIKKSRILEDHVLGFLDMMSGITIIKENNLYGFSVGSSSAMINVHSAPMYIVASEIKISE